MDEIKRTEMLDRVAEALWQSLANPNTPIKGTLLEQNKLIQNLWYRMAYEAVKAMQEPSKEMMSVIDRDYRIPYSYRKMMEKALNG